MPLILIICINIVALCFLLREIFKRKKAHLRIRDRLSPDLTGYSPAMIQQAIDLRRKTNELPGIFSWFTNLLPSLDRLGNRLEYIGKKITPQQYLLRLTMVTLIITFTISGLLKQSLLLGLLLGLALGALLPLKLLQWAVDKRNKAFLKLFPDAIDLIVRGLRAGLPVSVSISMVAQEIGEPVNSVFTTITNTMKFGVPLEAALRDQATKLDIPEFNFFAIAIGLQHETGGNLTEILENLSAVLRGRSRMLLKIRALSAEARASGYILSSLPFVIVGGFALFSPHYLAPLYQDPRGHVCIAAALIMLIAGLWIMRRVTQFEI